MSDPTNVYTVSVKQVVNGKTFWKSCGVAFLNPDDDGGQDSGKPKSVTIRLDLFPGVEMVAFPRRERSDIP